MFRDIQSEDSKALDRVEHNSDASAKRIVMRAFIPGTGEWVNPSAVDNGDGTYSLKTSGTGGGGAGTEYTEDVAAPANPAAPAVTLRRRDTLAAETTTDGDWVTANATNKGEQYTKAVDTDAKLDSLLTELQQKTEPTDTQPVSAASLPLPTGAATSDNQNPLDKYRIADEDTATVGTEYYGFTSATASNKWVILRIVTTGLTKTYRYANISNNTDIAYGTAGTGAWATRESLTYNLLYSLTGL